MMKLVPKPSMRAILSLSGVLGVGAAFMRPAPPPEMGSVAPIYAAPAEISEVRALGNGQTLGEVLSKSVGALEQHTLLTAFEEQASARRMQVGTEITLRWRTADHWLRGVDVALNPDSTVRLMRDEHGWRSAMIQTPIWTDTIFGSGEIDDALWNAVVQNQGLQGMPVRDRALLIDHLDKVFQWQVDFSRQIQDGDRYRFAFERQVRPDGSMRSGHIIAAELVNVGVSYKAFWFQPTASDRGAYYGPDGKSVKRAFLLKPLEFRRISSRFTNARFHPILNTWRGHRGVDYAAATGTEIMATADGVVTKRGPNGALGNAIEIRHPNGYLTRYGHMSRFNAAVKAGTRVHQGDVIGYVGMTGLATGPHLHYELWKAGRPVDPLKEIMPPGDPIPASDKPRWDVEMAGRIALLDGERTWRVFALGAPAAPAAPAKSAAKPAVKGGASR